MLLRHRRYLPAYMHACQLLIVPLNVNKRRVITNRIDILNEKWDIPEKTRSHSKSTQKYQLEKTTLIMVYEKKRSLTSCFWLADISKIFSSETTSQMEQNFTRSICGRSFTKFPRFILIGLQIWPPRAILVSDWLIFQKSSPLKPHGQMDPNFTGSIYGRSFTKFPYFVPIGLRIWPSQAILVSDWLIFQKYPVKPHGQMVPNFTGSICRRFFTKFPYFILIGLQIWPYGQFLFLIGWYFSRFKSGERYRLTRASSTKILFLL